jgi:GTP cyclohydrolase I
MTSPLAIELPDVQAERDDRRVALDEVGIAGLSLPLLVAGPGGSVDQTVADAEAVVSLKAEERGTHMSRFVEVLLSDDRPLSPGDVLGRAQALRDKLRAESARLVLRFPFFVERTAPVTGARAPLRVDGWIDVTTRLENRTVNVGASVPVTSLCPCSREISDYGAHSQRGRVEVTVDCPPWTRGEQGVWPHELVAVAEQAASAPVFPLLKRADERHVTMQAFDQPAFVEDIAREVVLGLQDDPRCHAWSVSVTNFESIHGHQAVARARGRRP